MLLYQIAPIQEGIAILGIEEKFIASSAMKIQYTSASEYNVQFLDDGVCPIYLESNYQVIQNNQVVHMDTYGLCKINVKNTEDIIIKRI